MKKASIIITAHNVADTIASAIDSALAQTYADFEVVIVDDASTDDTAKNIKKYAKRKNVSIITLSENVGIGKAKKTGAENAQGEYLCWLDGDDTLSPEYLSKMMSVAVEGSVVVATENDSATGKHLLFQSFNSMLMPMSMFRRIGYSELPFMEIEEVIIKVETFAREILVVRENLYNYTARESSVTHTRKREDFDVYRLLAYCNCYDNPMVRRGGKMPRRESIRSLFINLSDKRSEYKEEFERIDQYIFKLCGSLPVNAMTASILRNHVQKIRKS